MLFAATIMMIPGLFLLLKDPIKLTRRNVLTGPRRIVVAFFLVLPLPIIVLASLITALLINNSMVGYDAIQVITIMGYGTIIGGVMGALTYGLLIESL